MIYILVATSATVLMYIASLFRASVNGNKVILLDHGKTSISLFAIVYRIFVVLSCGGLIILSAFRYNVGTDFDSYANRVVNDVFDGNSNKEILFQVIVKFSEFLGSTQWIFIITSVLFVYFIYKAIIDQSKNIWLSVFLIMFTTFYSFSLNAIRQALATAIFLFAIKYISNKKFYRYLIWILIAAGIHKAALIYLPFYFLFKLKIQRLREIIIVMGVAVFLFGIQQYVRKLVVYLASFTQYSNYAGSQFDDSLIYVSLSFLLLNVLVTIFILISSWRFEFDDNLKLLVWIQLIATVFSGISFSIPAAYRIFYLLVPVQIIMVPNLISLYRSKAIRNIIALTAIIIYFSLFYFFIIHANYNGTLPYQFNFSF